MAASIKSMKEIRRSNQKPFIKVNCAGKRGSMMMFLASDSQSQLSMSGMCTLSFHSSMVSRKCWPGSSMEPPTWST